MRHGMACIEGEAQPKSRRRRNRRCPARLSVTDGLACPGHCSGH